MHALVPELVSRKQIGIADGSSKIIAFINYEGGVAKTTSTYHIGCRLAGVKNKRVLLIDIDPQTNLTFLCAPIEKWERRKSKIGTIATMYRRYLDGKPVDTRRYLWRTPIAVQKGKSHPRIDLSPCDIDLIGEDIGGGTVTGSYPTMEMLRRNADHFVRERQFLSTAIREVQDDYDYVPIDCPPNLYLMTQNALVASHQYVVTAIPDHLSTIGLNILEKQDGRHRRNRGIRCEAGRTRRRGFPFSALWCSALRTSANRRIDTHVRARGQDARSQAAA